MRFHRLRLLHTLLGNPAVRNFQSPHQTLLTYQTSSARTADNKLDLNAPPEVYVELAFKGTTDFSAETQFS
jgi:hypothetical protein